MIFQHPIKPFRLLYPSALWRMDGADGSVYLTFDDGPIPESTPFLLETLKHFGAKATFFVVGDNVRKYPELFEAILREGHAVGNHTFHHLRAKKFSVAHYLDDIGKAQTLIEKEADFFEKESGEMKKEKKFFPSRKNFLEKEKNFLEKEDENAGENYGKEKKENEKNPSPDLSDNKALPLFRPPHGSIPLRHYRAVAERYRIVQWDIVTRDYNRHVSAEHILRTIQAYARPGSIINMHDSLRSIDKLHTALPAALEWLIQQGYTLQTL